jgi:hypothetical protein
MKKMTGGTLASASKIITEQAKQIEELKKQLAFEKELYKMLQKDNDENIWYATMEEKIKENKVLKKKVEIQKNLITATLKKNSTIKHEFKKAMKDRKKFWKKKTRKNREIKRLKEVAEKNGVNTTAMSKVLNLSGAKIHEHINLQTGEIRLSKKKSNQILREIYCNIRNLIYEQQLEPKRNENSKKKAEMKYWQDTGLIN